MRGREKDGPGRGRGTKPEELSEHLWTVAGAVEMGELGEKSPWGVRGFSWFTVLIWVSSIQTLFSIAT